MPQPDRPMPLVVIVGRPNVGKSTLFNRIAGRRQAIVEDTPGVTRDRIEARVEWGGRVFTLADTGGFDEPGTHLDGRATGQGVIATAVREQVARMVREADLILLVVDGKVGLQPGDEALADMLRKTGRPVILVVNKIDSERMEDRVYEFFRLGLGEPLSVSAEHGRNVGDLLDMVLEKLPETLAGRQENESPLPPDEAPSITRVCVVGRPNVGKSSLINQLIDDQRVIVSEIPGTTRDAVDVLWRADSHEFLLIDTAGLRRKSRIGTSVEYYSSLRTVRSIERADVALIVIDGTGPVTEQDKKVAGLVHERGKASIILVNKWDAAPAGVQQSEYEEDIRYRMSFMDYAPVLFVSARTGLNLRFLPDLIARVAANHSFRAGTDDVNRVIHDAQAMHAPPGRKGRHLKIYYATQAAVKPPTFVLFVNDPELVHQSYERYLENRLREAFDFSGTPVRFLYRARRRQLLAGREPM